jgi:hypothetical protein
MGRGNPTSAQVRAARREKVKGDLEDGIVDVLDTYAKEELGVSRWTLYRDLEKIGARKDAIRFTPEERLTLRRAQYDVLLKLELATTAGTIPPDVANALVGIRREIAKLLDINPETRSTRLNLNVDASADPATLGFFDRFMRAAARRTPEQMEEVFRFMENLPNIYVDVTPPPMMLPPGAEVQE